MLEMSRSSGKADDLPYQSPPDRDVGEISKTDILNSPSDTGMPRERLTDNERVQSKCATLPDTKGRTGVEYKELRNINLPAVEKLT